MKIAVHFRYATAVWLTSLFLSPVLMIIYLAGWEIFLDPQGVMGFLILALLIGAFFSIPNWLLLTAGVRLINERPWPALRKKLLIHAWATLLTVALFGLMFGAGQGWQIGLFYWGTLSFGIWNYPLMGSG
mgnify:CR=1 FL=1